MLHKNLIESHLPKYGTDDNILLQIKITGLIDCIGFFNSLEKLEVCMNTHKRDFGDYINILASPRIMDKTKHSLCSYMNNIYYTESRLTSEMSSLKINVLIDIINSFLGLDYIWCRVDTKCTIPCTPKYVAKKSGK